MRSRGGLPRKELKAPDPFLTWSGRTILWARKNARLLLRLLVAVVLVVAGVLSYRAYREANRLRAEEALFQALALRRQSGGKQEALDALSRLVDRYAGYPAGERARLFLGEHYFQEGRYREAQEAFLAALHGADGVEAQVARRGLAKSLAAAGRCGEAIPLWEDMIKSEGRLPHQDLYLAVGQCYEATGATEKAVATYRELREKHPASPFLSADFEEKVRKLEGG
ncbi:MAG: tetratricopeptide repeat protein [Nitrospinota bacterium]